MFSTETTYIYNGVVPLTGILDGLHRLAENVINKLNTLGGGQSLIVGISDWFLLTIFKVIWQAVILLIEGLGVVERSVHQLRRKDLKERTVVVVVGQNVILDVGQQIQINELFLVLNRPGLRLAGNRFLLVRQNIESLKLRAPFIVFKVGSLLPVRRQGIEELVALKRSCKFNNKAGNVQTGQ